MNNLMFFKSIPITTPKDKVYQRLGYQRDKTRLSPLQRIEIEQYIEEANSFIKLQGITKRIAIKENQGLKIILEETVVFESKQLAVLLKDCKEIFFIGVTAGKEIMGAIQKETSENNLTKAVVFDAAASEAVDSALDWSMSFMNKELSRENKYLTKKRFSAGYGDFLLENQRVLFNVLKLDNLGVKLTDSFMLIPEKSVTAVAGILERVEG